MVKRTSNNTFDPFFTSLLLPNHPQSSFDMDSPTKEHSRVCEKEATVTTTGRDFLRIWPDHSHLASLCYILAYTSAFILTQIFCDMAPFPTLPSKFSPTLSISVTPRQVSLHFLCVACVKFLGAGFRGHEKNHTIELTSHRFCHSQWLCKFVCWLLANL